MDTGTEETGNTSPLASEWIGRARLAPAPGADGMPRCAHRVSIIRHRGLLVRNSRVNRSNSYSKRASLVKWRDHGGKVLEPRQVLDERQLDGVGRPLRFLAMIASAIPD